MDTQGHGQGRGDVLVEVDGLTKRFGAQVAVDDVSFTLRAGTVTGFLGPNGAGKSTTMRMMVGLTAPITASTATASSPSTRTRPRWALVRRRRIGTLLR